MLDLNHVYEIDVIEGLKRLPEKSVNLFIIDPPYYRVKGDFDFVLTWEQWIDLHEKLAVECKRVMAENGTLFIWGDKKKIAYQQIIFDKFFKLENSLVWRKVDSMQYQYYSPQMARTFNTHNERLLMYSFDFEPGEWELTGWEKVLEEKIRPQHPFALYLKSEFERAGVTNKEVAALFPSTTGGLTGCVSNWLQGYNVVTPEQYQKIREYLNTKGGDYLRREYEDLRREYEDLRRPFFNQGKLEEVLEFSQEGYITKNYDHETKKPEGLTTALIETCSRPGDLVCAPFAGSGTECAMAAKLGRKWVGFDNVPAYVKMSNDRANKMANKVDVLKPIKDANDYTNLNTGLFAQQPTII